MKNNQEKGKAGEQLAADYLEKNGYVIVERNYRYKRSEIDIIAEHEGVLVFVEVKARSSSNFGMPEEAVGEAKARKLMEGAENYILETDWKGDIRFDIISIMLKMPSTEIAHFQDAFH